jgi:hypothetical protein
LRKTLTYPPAPPTELVATEPLAARSNRPSPLKSPTVKYWARIDAS